MPHLTLGVLGPLQIALANAPIAKLESDKARALLIHLAVEAAHAHRREALIGLVWPDYPEETARHNLRQALFNLRRAIGDDTATPPFLFITRDEIQFNPASDYSLDLAEFDAHLAACASHPHQQLETCALCASRMQHAVDLYRGKFLQQFFLEDSAEFEEWALARREATHQRALDALTHLANYYEQHGDLAATRRCALRQLELDPWREQAHRQMMRVLAMEGQRNAALAQYEMCRRMLAKELGVEPSVETRELFEKIKTGDSRLEIAASQPPVSGLQSPVSVLPTQLTPFLGRECELAELGQLIADDACRLLTLVAPGGMGKTRLAIQAAAQARAQFAHGVAFVPLAAINSTEAVIPAMADALGLSFYGPTSPRTQLANFLRDKQMLVLLDNVEQLVDAAELFVELLQHAPALKLLLTSREPLNVQGEWVFQVAGLEIPKGNNLEDSSAAALFIQRARRTRTGLVLNDSDRAAVARLCRLVEGMPLALELAAAWVGMLSCQEIVSELESNIDFLAVSMRNLPERHRSLRACFDHSWRLLSDAERVALSCLSIFQGGFDRAAAQQIAGATLPLLSLLVSKSLVRHIQGGRYDLHEVIRQYALSHLEDAPSKYHSVRDAHSAYYLRLAAEREADLKSARQQPAVQELVSELANLRTAWAWAIQREMFALTSPAVRALGWFFDVSGLVHEGIEYFEPLVRALKTLPETPAGQRTLGQALTQQGNLCFRKGQMERAQGLVEQGLEILHRLGEPTVLTDALNDFGIITHLNGDIDRAQTLFKEGLACAQSAKDEWGVAYAIYNLGYVASLRGHYARGSEQMLKGLAILRRLGDAHSIALCQSYLTPTLVKLGRYDQAHTFSREALELYQAAHNRWGISTAYRQLGLVEMAQGNQQEAQVFFRKALETFGDYFVGLDIARTLIYLGESTILAGDLEQARTILLKSLQLSREIHSASLMLDAILELATVEMRANPECAYRWLTVVAAHPRAAHESRTRAAQLREELSSLHAPPHIESEWTLERVLQDAMGT